MFFQVDDDFWGHRKVTQLIDEQGASKAAPAFMLWTLAGSMCRKKHVDGVVTKGDAKRIMDTPALAARAARMLVSVDLWHEPGHSCEKCPPVEDGTWLFHDWFQFKYATGAAEIAGIARRKELRDPAIVEAVWARDTAPNGTTTCRYCEKTVLRPQRGKHGGLRRAAEVGQLDHVDPARAVGATNIVVACAECNNRKNQRTPEQAGMTLKPPPGGARDQVVDQVAIKTRSTPDLSPTRVRPRGGAGGVGAGVGVGVEALGGSPGSAGEAPVVPVPAAFGSPWHGHHGAPPPQDLIDEATCQTHDLPKPCRKCAAESYDLGPTAWPASPADPPPSSPPRTRPRRRGSRGGRSRNARGES